MSEEPRKVGARCRVCNQQLTVDEFRACKGVGHYCTAHLPASRVRAASANRPSRPKTSTGAGRSTGNRRGRRLSANGYTEYSCKAQFARRAELRAGRLTSDHPSCDPGSAVFVYNEVGYGPGEIDTLFIRDPEGRELARRAGFNCHD